MASHRPSKRPRLLAAQANDGSLPRDELEEVLLRLPSKPLARLRTISHSWRSLISAPHFVAEHARRCEADSLLVVPVYTASPVDVKLVDMASGAVVAQLDSGSNGRFVGMSGSLLCSVSGSGDTAAIRVLNLATGAVTSIAAGTSAAGGMRTSSAYVFGQVPKTGEHKILRVYTSCDHSEQSCEILTLGGREQSWRPAASPPVLVGGTDISRHRAVTQGVVHFMTSDRAEYDGIASFDLATEQWRPTLLQGPLSSDGRHCQRTMLSLVDLNGCLVYVHHDYRFKSIDIWVLADQVTWLRIKSLRQGSVLQRGEIMVQPLMVLDDGRIALWVAAPNGIVRLYDPRTDSCRDVVSVGKHCSTSVGLYTGSLLGFMK
ncbi:hypothetical protein BS78_01G479600 [Paspalum vaginatum]|nr:hypothetical protein BS78_01G479600 [Paspalum vaginatum]